MHNYFKSHSHFFYFIIYPPLVLLCLRFSAKVRVTYHYTLFMMNQRNSLGGFLRTLLYSGVHLPCFSLVITIPICLDDCLLVHQAHAYLISHQRHVSRSRCPMQTTSRLFNWLYLCVLLVFICPKSHYLTHFFVP